MEFALERRFAVAEEAKPEGKQGRPRAVAPPKFENYWKLRMDGATMRLKAAQQIISHPGTRGSLAENLLRELIRGSLWTP